MRTSDWSHSISHLAAHADEELRELAARREPLVITRGGEAVAVMQDIASWTAEQEMLALLKILALGELQVEVGQTSSVAEVVKRLRAKTRVNS